MKKLVTILSVTLLLTGTAFADGNDKVSKTDPLTLVQLDSSTPTEKDTGGSGGGSDPKPPTSETPSTDDTTSSDQSWVLALVKLIFE